MVKPGGEPAMLGHWRIVLKQAEEAARVGRYEEAFALSSRPDVADHLHAVQFRARLALDLIARATRRGAVDDLSGAVEDLDLAERMGAPPDSLAAARLSLAERVSAEVRADLEAGAPARALERIEGLARHKVCGPALRRSREIAEAWEAAMVEGRRGEFGRAQEQLDRAERLAGGANAPRAREAVAAAKAELENRQKTAAPRVEALYQALGDGQWPAILSAAEAVLAVVPEHPAARQARSRAWRQIAAIGPAAPASAWPARGFAGGPDVETRPVEEMPLDERGGPVPAGNEHENGPRAPGHEGIVWLGAAVEEARGELRPRCGPRPPVDRHLDRRPNAPGMEIGRPLAPPSPLGRPCPAPAFAPAAARPLARPRAVGPRGRFLLWVDGVGGYLVCLDDRVVLGRAGADSHADVPLMGDLSRDHATVERNGEGYLLQAHHASFINGKPVSGQAVLHDGDIVRLGPTVELEFRQPSPVSATARLAIVSRHRLPLAVDGVLLMADTCIVGEPALAHVPAQSLGGDVVLYRQAGALWCRAPGAFDVDGRTCAARAPLTLHSSVLGDGFSFSLEPLGTRTV